MRILIAPLGLPMKTSGPAARLKTLAREGARRGHELAVCAALDGNISPDTLPREIHWMNSPAPSILGLPKFLGRALSFVIGALGLTRNAEITSFEQVLKLGGVLEPDFFASDVHCLRGAIRDFRPDVVFSEYRVQAVAAALLEKVPVAGTHSFPGQAGFAASPEASEKVRAWLVDQGLSSMDSVLRLLERMDIRFVASSPELEPFEASVVHVGPLTPLAMPKAVRKTDSGRGKVVFYLGNSSISPARMIRTGKALADSGFETYIAASGHKPGSVNGCHVAQSFDFSQLLPGAEAFINHGGQNSAMQGLASAVPQIIFPGKVFERKYNARSVARLGAGLALDDALFNPADLARSIRDLADSKTREKARAAGERLMALGGAGKVYDELEKRYAK